MNESLTFSQLREANLKRLPVFKNSKGEPAHSKPDGSDWTRTEWLEAVIGEIGEYANFAKKYRRGDIARDVFISNAKKELADTQCYLDLFAYQCSVDFKEEFDVAINDICLLGDALVIPMDTPSKRLALFNNAIGHIGNNIYAYDYKAFPEAAMVEYLKLSFVKAEKHLVKLAGLWEVNLAEATREKFNEVSDRIGCDIKL